MVRYALIVLRSSPERVARAEDLAKRVPSLLLHDAVEKRALPPMDELVRGGVVASRHELFTLGQVACALSHLALLSAAAAAAASGGGTEDEWHVTLEDDVDVVDGFEARVEAALASLPASADMCYLHVFDGREADVAAQEEVAPGIHRATRMFATWGIAFKPRGAARLAERILPMAKAVDNVLADMVEARELEAYACLPPLVTSRGDLGPFQENRRAMRSTVWHDD